MNRLLIFLAFLILTFSCHQKVERHKVQQGFKLFSFELVDSLGIVDMQIPTYCDTFLNWLDHSDCTCCEYYKYRFQPKTYPINLESGFIYIDPDLKDSINTITFKHSACLYNHFKIDTLSYLKFDSFHQQRKMQDFQYLKDAGLIFDSVFIINSQYYSVFFFDRYDSINKRFIKELKAKTNFNNSWIEINYKLVTKKNDSINNYFFELSKTSLKSIKLAHTSKK